MEVLWQEGAREAFFGDFICKVEMTAHLLEWLAADREATHVTM